MNTPATDGGAMPRVCVVCRREQNPDQFFALRDHERFVTTCLTCRRAKQRSEAASRRSIQLMQAAAAGHLRTILPRPAETPIAAAAVSPAPSHAYNNSLPNMHQPVGSANTNYPVTIAATRESVGIQNPVNQQHGDDTSQTPRVDGLKPRDQWLAGTDPLRPATSVQRPLPILTSSGSPSSIINSRGAPPISPAPVPSPLPLPPRERGQLPNPLPPSPPPPRKRGRPPLPMPSSPLATRRPGRPPLPMPSSPPPRRKPGRPPLPRPSVSPSPPRRPGRPPIQGPRLPPQPPRKRGRPPTQGPRLPPRPRGRPRGSTNRPKPPRPDPNSDPNSDQPPRS
ncbi:hypothetical protein GGR50DRAFT_586420 [Xylaria sp. CBS 124048]|nr:hypothetical protein GGR50DRAFT_586420 [Xylaria sp. CBS 124048]